MTKFIALLVAVMAVAGFAVEASAGKKCKDGYRYDPATKMCWPVRGSH